MLRRIWTGEQAYSIGLVDELGGMNTAKDIMQELLGKKGKLNLLTLLQIRKALP
jgi:ClpP class serine protease